MKIINVCLLFVELKLDKIEGTAKEITHLHIFIKFIKKNKKKKTVKLQIKKKSIAIEENK